MSSAIREILEQFHLDAQKYRPKYADNLAEAEAAIDAEIERIIGEDAIYRKLEPCPYCNADRQYKCSCAEVINNHLDLQRARASNTEKK